MGRALVPLFLDLSGTLAFAVNGALTASRATWPAVSAPSLGMLTGLGGGTIRDIPLGAQAGDPRRALLLARRGQERSTMAILAHHGLPCATS